VAKIRGEIEAVEKRREALTAVDLALGQERVAADAARRSHEALAQADVEIRALDERIGAAEVKLQPARDELECAKAAEGAQRARLDAAVAASGFGSTSRAARACACFGFRLRVLKNASRAAIVSPCSCSNRPRLKNRCGRLGSIELAAFRSSDAPIRSFDWALRAARALSASTC
jgi:hypothetical protein